MRSGVLVEGESRDVSLSGVWFVTQRSLPVGNQVWVQLLVSEHQYGIRTEGQVARVGEDGLGVAFTKIPEDSLECLRSIVGHSTKGAGQAKAKPKPLFAAAKAEF